MKYQDKRIATPSLRMNSSQLEDELLPAGDYHPY